MALRSLFIDFNSYFASVEQQENASLRGKPIAVVPVKAETTCCIAASYEAKRLGIKTGTSVSEARLLCSNIQIIEAHPALYVQYHNRLKDAVDSCIPIEKVFSIDEMSCQLTGSQRQREKAVALAQQIKKTIAQKIGSELRSSIGIAPNNFLAKTASDMQKPDGCVVIESTDLPHCLFPLQLNDLTGIGRRMERRLWRNGIYTVEQLCTVDKKILRRVWNGIEGERMYDKLRGELVSLPPTHRSTVGHSHVLPPELRTNDAAFAVLHRLLQKAAMRLRSYNCIAGSLMVRIKYINKERWGDDLNIDPTSDTITLLDAFTTMWNSSPLPEAKPLMVSVVLYKLTDERSHTPSLFGKEHQRTELNKALDKLNYKFGKNSVFYAGATSALTSAPMRIAFNHIPDLKTESDE